MPVSAEIAIAAAAQLGALIWFLSGMKSDLRNLTGWVKSIAADLTSTMNKTAELKGQVESLPCARCDVI